MSFSFSSSPHVYRVALLDDHDVVLQGFASCLEKTSDLKVVGQYKTLPEMLTGLQSESADVLVVDYSLGPKNTDGLNMLSTLSRQFPKAKVLVASAHDNPTTVALAMRAGAKGFLGKTKALVELVDAIRTLMVGRTYLSPALSTQQLAEVNMQLAEDSTESMTILSDEKKLSPREKEVLRCFLEGMTVTEIAIKFIRSPKTISTQKHHAYRKLGIRSDPELFKMRHLLESTR